MGSAGTCSLYIFAKKFDEVPTGICKFVVAPGNTSNLTITWCWLSNIQLNMTLSQGPQSTHTFIYSFRNRCCLFASRTSPGSLARLITSFATGERPFCSFPVYINLDVICRLKVLNKRRWAGRLKTPGGVWTRARLLLLPMAAELPENCLPKGLPNPRIAENWLSLWDKLNHEIFSVLTEVPFYKTDVSTPFTQVCNCTGSKTENYSSRTFCFLMDRKSFTG